MGRVARYQAIYNDLAAQIHDGILTPGTALPGEAELSELYHVSRMTVRQALDQLVRERAVIRRHGIRTIVASPSTAGRHLSTLQPIHAELGVPPDEVTTEIIEASVKPPEPAVAQRLGLAPEALAAMLSRVRIIGGHPAVIQTSWLPSTAVPQLTREPLLGGSLYRTLQERYGIHLSWAEQQIRASAATRAQARLLNVPDRSPLIMSERLTYNEKDIPVEYSRSWTTNEHPVVIRLENT